MATVDGFKSTIQFGLVESVRITPPAGAGEARLTVPLMLRVTPTFAESSASVTGTVTFAIADAARKPSAEAVRVAFPIMPGVIGAFAPIDPCGTVTLDCTAATLGSLVVRLTTCP